METRQENQITRPFGEPLDEELLLGFADVDATDIESAINWWDENASEDWRGVLDAPPFEGL